MAKGNMLQGMARGKVGDVVFSRLNGEQIARVRNRNPKNPRTNAQLYQRAIMATVMQAYSAGKIILDHSFEGYSVGEGCQRRFMSMNAKQLRAIIAADLAGSATPATQQGRVVAPGSTYPVPTVLQVSEGSLINSFVDGGKWTQPLTGETLAQYCSRLGLVAGDLFTAVAFAIPTDAQAVFSVIGDDTNYSKQFTCQFLYARYAVKASALESTAVASQASLTDLLELTDSNATASSLSNRAWDDLFDISYFFTDYTKGSYAIIRSRLDEDLRSSEKLMMVFDENSKFEWGIASSFALAAWKQGTEKIGDSDLILEGGDA